MPSSHTSCPFAVDTHCGTLCDATNRKCTGCDWQDEYPHCDWLGEHCEEGKDCVCRTCDTDTCEDCWEKMCARVGRDAVREKDLL